jgi:drug/metabolite transporter (DMT)-like permease
MTAHPTTEPVTRQGPSAAQLWTALWTVYLIWGSTYLAIRVVVRSMPALGAMGVRFLAAGVIMTLILRWRRGRGAIRVTRQQLGAAAVVGALLLLGGNGLVAVGEKTVPSGLAALLVAGMPLWLVVLRTVFSDRPKAMSVVGTLVGFAGIGLLALPGGHSGAVKLWGVLTIVAATICWATGSFLSSRLPLPQDAFVTTTYEMLCGGVLMLVVSLVTGEAFHYSLSDIQPEGLVALAYLVVFGSLIAFTAFSWLLANAPVSLVTTYAYVNPIVAVILGWLILSEPVTTAILVGGALAVLGVALVVRAERR